MKTTPYELVFGQPPHLSVFPGAKRNCVMEEDVEDLFEENSTTDPSQNQPQIETISEPDIHAQIELETETMSEQSNSDTYLKTETTAEQLNLDTFPQSETTSEQHNLDSFPLGTSAKHFNLRKEADKHYRRNAESMKLKYCKGKRKKVLTFRVGDFVSVRIPRIDRSSTDSHRLLCVIVERLGSKFHLYRLRYMKYIYYDCVCN